MRMVCYSQEVSNTRTTPEVSEEPALKTRLISGDNGTLTFWDYKTGVPFQHAEDIPQPGSLDAEAGVFCSTFDHTGTRLITGGADKTIKAGSFGASLRAADTDASHSF